MTLFKFNYKKSLQAIAVLLGEADLHTDNYMRLIKLLYIADRESLKETGRPITGDRIVAMKQGPVLSRVLDLIKGEDVKSPEWSKFIKRTNYRISLIDNPGNDELCPYEIRKLQEIWERYQSKDEWEMVEETHKFPEWLKNNPGESSKRIPLEDILEAIGRADDFAKIRQSAMELSAFDDFFGG